MPLRLPVRARTSIRGAGTIDRIWMTIEDRSPEGLRGLKLEMFWDGAATPAVSVPLGDFFLHGAGEMLPMETALFASREGRSFVSYVPMPFRTGARLVVTNVSLKPVNLIFFDVDFRALPAQPADALYFHAGWRRERATQLGRDSGSCRASPARPLPGRQRHGPDQPGLREDLVGRGRGQDRARRRPFRRADVRRHRRRGLYRHRWGQGAYVNRYQGAPVATWDGEGRWTFYRFHVPGPVWFHRDIEVSLQQIGGARKNIVLGLLNKGAPMIR